MNDIMLHEIMSQPEYVKSGLTNLRQNIQSLKFNGERVVMGGCGDSWFSAIAVSGLFTNRGIPYISATSQEIEQFIQLSSTDLVVFSSISGTTKRTLIAAEKARNSSALTLAITCDPNSPLSGICNKTLDLSYRPITRKTPHTLDYLLTLLAQVLIMEKLSGETLNGLEKLPEVINRVIQISLNLAELFCREIRTESNFFFLGAGDKSGTAMYGAAKLHEAGGLIACHCEPENFWHGQNFMVKPEDVIIVFGNPNEPAEIERYQIETLQQLTPLVLYIGHRDVNAPYSIRSEVTPDFLIPFTDAVAPQVLCYCVANILDIQVDDPAIKLQRNQNHIAAQSSWFSQKQVTNF